ncbi:unnamed protein product [Amoebophrya sp. A25]|nr:unnamed protein product [Amoebophrya sp. A25]|eukprot:GSA25T00020943001.1
MNITTNTHSSHAVPSCSYVLQCLLRRRKIPFRLSSDILIGVQLLY